MKILLISGHGAGDTGAVGCGYKEADLTRQATELLDKYIKAYDVSVTRYPVSHDAYQDNKRGNLQYSFKAFNLVVEVHFNSYNKSAYGSEVLYKQESIKPLASKISAGIASFGFYNRGAKYRSDLMNMNTCYRMGIPYILIETAFIDNSSDMTRYHNNMSAIWKKVADVIAGYYGFGKSSGTTPAPQTPSSSQSKPKPSQSSAKIAVDGSWGQATTKLAQKVLGTTVDGIVSNQPMVNKRYLPNCSTYSWQFKTSGYRGGSSMVRALQKMIGASADGYFGPNSIRKFQKFLGVAVDASCGPATVKAWQKWLNTKVK